jgi:aldose 1-epimerase
VGADCGVAPVIAPSGEQVELTHGDQRAVVVEVGGGLREYSQAGHDLLDGYPVDAMSSAGRGQVLLPWPNRIEDGSYEFDERRHQLAINDPADQNAIHGLVRWAAWDVTEHEPSRTVLEHLLRPHPGYPFLLAVRIEYRLGDDGLRVRTTATNAGTHPCPYGAGAHPYLTLGTPAIDPLLLSAPARTVLLSNERGIPVSSEPVEGGAFDFRTPRPIGAIELDHCFTDLDRRDDGRAGVELRDPDSGRGLTLWVDESYSCLMLFTGDPIPDVSRRSLAVEPMTCPPNAFRSAEGLARLEPGESFTSTWGITPSGP